MAPRPGAETWAPLLRGSGRWRSPRCCPTRRSRPMSYIPAEQQALMAADAKRARYMGELDRIAQEGKSVRSFRVFVLTPGDKDWVSNGMRYRLPGIAGEAADSLRWRWTAVRDVLVLPWEDEPNTDDHGNLI